MLPVTPSGFELTNPHINKVVNINELGDINLIGKRGLSEISISGFFPKQNYYFCKTTPLDPQEYIDMIIKWKNSNKPIRFIITKTNINIAVSIENFIHGVKDGTGDVYFTLELKEYRFLKANNMREVKAIPDEYTVRTDDTLWTIAKKETGNGSNYKVIQKSNNLKPSEPLMAGYKVNFSSSKKLYESPVLGNLRNQLGGVS
jgi:basic membrane lipoprotein Med (substrate-binding protein (PBP1-ABC) superfamily)